MQHSAKYAVSLFLAGLLFLFGLLLFHNPKQSQSVRADDSNKTEMYGVFPLVRKNQAFEWRDNRYQLKPELLAVLDKEYVAGITFYLSWGELEPVHGTFDWQLGNRNFLNQIVEAAKARGKIVNLGIAPAQFSPEWIYEDSYNIVTHRYFNAYKKQQTLAPIPWNQNYLSLYFAAISTLGQKIKDSPNFYSPIKRIMIGGPSNVLGFEMTLDGNPADQQFYLSNGYPDQYVAAWKQAVDAFVEKIPTNIELNLVWHRGLRGHWTNEYSKQIVDYIVERGLINRVNLMSLGLKGTDWWNFSDSPHPAGDPTKEKEMILMLADEQQHGFKIGLQTFSDAMHQTNNPNIGNYEQVVKNANSMQIVWFEPWVEDILVKTEGSVGFERREELLLWLNNQLKKESPHVCFIDGKPVTQAYRSLLGIPLNQYAPPLNGEGGFNDATKTIVEKLADAKVHFARRGLHWQVLERQGSLPSWCNSDSQYCWGMYDRMIEEIKNLGMEPVIMIGGVPEWISTAPDIDQDGDGHKDNFAAYPPADINDWKNFVRAIVERYGYGPGGRKQVRNWEIWNEPDIDQFFRGTSDDYLRLLNSAYDVIKEEDPSAKIWGPTTLYFLEDIDWTPDKHKYPFSQKAIQQGKMDVFSVHVYADLEESYRRISQLRNNLDAAGKQNIPIAITETNEWIPPHSGITTCYDNITDEQQARMLTERYYCLANAGAQSVFWWKPTDSEDNRCEDEIQENGLFRTDLTSKPAYDALKIMEEYLDESCSPINPTCDGTTDLSDLLSWRRLWAGGKPEADVNHDGQTNILDYLFLLRGWL